MEQTFKIVHVAKANDEVLATAANFLMARAAYDTALSIWPKSWIEVHERIAGEEVRRGTFHQVSKK